MTDSINEEIRAIRRQLAVKFDNDLGKIFADLRRQEELAKTQPNKPPQRPDSDAENSATKAGL